MTAFLYQRSLIIARVIEPAKMSPAAGRRRLDNALCRFSIPPRSDLILRSHPREARMGVSKDGPAEQRAPHRPPSSFETHSLSRVLLRMRAVQVHTRMRTGATAARSRSP